MAKKFRESCKVWVQYGLFLLRTKHDADGARKLLQRALKSLPKRKRTCMCMQRLGRRAHAMWACAE